MTIEVPVRNSDWSIEVVVARSLRIGRGIGKEE